MAWQKVLDRYGLVKESRIGYPTGIGYPPDWGEHTASLRKDGFDGAVKRAKMYLAAGADMAYADAIESEDQIKRLCDALGPGIVSVNMGFGIRQQGLQQGMAVHDAGGRGEQGGMHMQLRLQRTHPGGIQPLQIIHAIGDVEVNVALFVGAAVALHIHAPGVKTFFDEVIHRR